METDFTYFLLFADEQIDLEKQELFRDKEKNKIDRCSPASNNSARFNNSDRHISSNYSSRRGSGNNNRYSHV